MRGWIANDNFWRRECLERDWVPTPVCWQPLPPPPPAPDAFEEWWEKLSPYADSNELNAESRWTAANGRHTRPVTKVDARAIWNAALASKGAPAQ